MVPNPRPGEDRAVVLVSGRAARLCDRPVRFGVYIARSVNAGVSFRHPAHLFPSNLNLNAGEAAILSDGTLLVSFIDFMRNVDDFRSREGMLERRRIWMYRSTDEGRTFSEPLFVTEPCIGSRYVAADLSTGPHAGRAYVPCRQCPSRPAPVRTPSETASRSAAGPTAATTSGGPPRRTGGST